MGHKFPELQALFYASAVWLPFWNFNPIQRNFHTYFHCVEITFSVPVSTLYWDILVDKECVLSILCLFNECGSWLIVDD